MPADNLPIGTILIWAGDPGDLPSTWKVCNGKQLKKIRLSRFVWNIRNKMGQRQWICC
jgi:hypothetical protein